MLQEDDSDNDDDDATMKAATTKDMGPFYPLKFLLIFSLFTYILYVCLLVGVWFHLVY